MMRMRYPSGGRSAIRLVWQRSSSCSAPAAAQNAQSQQLHVAVSQRIG
jgi:hypothetical protein